MNIPRSPTDRGDASVADADWIRELARGTPRVTVVIPCKEEAQHIGRCLEAVLAQDISIPIEVLVVDGMSTDGTRGIVESVASRDRRVRLLDNPDEIVPPAMNIGIHEASGDFIVRVDGHCRVPSDYIREVLQAFRDSGAGCVGGAMVAEGGDTYWASVIASATSTAFAMGGRRFHGRGKPREMDTVYLGAYPKRVLVSLGLYDERFVRNQDDELNYRLRSKGGRVYFTPKIWAAYTNRSTLRKLASQYAQYGWWKVQVYRKHPRQLHVRHLVPTAFLLALVTTIVVAMAVGGGAWAFPLALLVLHLGAGALLCLEEGVSLVRLPGVLFVCWLIHVSYGAGFLAGLSSLPFSLRVARG